MTDTPVLNWPPDFIVKHHPRARGVKLKASARNGLELVVPKNFNAKKIPSILESHKAWIVKQLLKLNGEILNKKEWTLPTEIIFAGINKTWLVNYIPTDKKIQIITRPHQELVLMGKIANKTVCKKILVAWMKQYAQIHLLDQLQLISTEIQLPYSNAIVRDQQTRWGSCSSDKSISLNYKLLLLPPQLMRHIIIHELCHTVHLNHSDKFWRLVERFDPDWKTHKKDTRIADKLIPDWIK